MNNEKSVDLIYYCIEEILNELRLKNLTLVKVKIKNNVHLMTIYYKRNIPIMYLYVSPPEIKINDANIKINLVDPKSLDILKIEIEYAYTILTNPRWKSILKLPISLSRYFYKYRKINNEPTTISICFKILKPTIITTYSIIKLTCENVPSIINNVKKWLKDTPSIYNYHYNQAKWK